MSSYFINTWRHDVCVPKSETKKKEDKEKTKKATSLKLSHPYNLHKKKNKQNQYEIIFNWVSATEPNIHNKQIVSPFI